MKSEEKERDRGTVGEILYPIPGNLAHTGDEQKDGKQKKNKKKETGSGAHNNPASLGHLVTHYDPHGSFCEPILNTSSLRNIFVYVCMYGCAVC